MRLVERTALTRRIVLSMAAAAMVAILPACGGGDDDSKPVATWAAGISDLREDVSFAQALPDTTPIANRTIRQVKRIAVGGEGLRIKFSNLFGSSPLVLTKVSVASSAGGGSKLAGTEKSVMFSGASGISIAPGEDAWSDPIDMDVASGSDIAVSIFVASAAPITTAHRLSGATRYEGDGDLTGALSLPPATVNASMSYWMREIDVFRSARTNVLVTFGDSITDGSNAGTNLNRRYPDALAARYYHDTGQPPVSVVNTGIGGNRWMNDIYGLRGVERFKRDVLTVEGVTHALVLLGVNDIGFQFSFKPDQIVTADDVIQAMLATVAAGNAAGVKVYFGTLTPFKGAFYYREEAESIRQAINVWVRTNTAAAGFIDFDKAVQDPADPLQFRAGLSGDSLHPNAEGYQLMADAVDLAMFR